MSGYKCFRIQGEGLTLDVLGQGWQRSVLSGSSQRLGSCSQDLCWVGFWSHVFVHLNRGSQVLSDNCHRCSTVDLEQTHYTFAISIVVSYKWFLSRETTDSSVYRGRGRKVHTSGRSCCDHRLVVMKAWGGCQQWNREEESTHLENK